MQNCLNAFTLQITNYIAWTNREQIMKNMNYTLFFFDILENVEKDAEINLLLQNKKLFEASL